MQGKTCGACKGGMLHSPLGLTAIATWPIALCQELLDLVAIPSVSSLPENQPDILRAAAWLEARLKKAGMEVRVQRGCIGAPALPSLACPAC